MALEQHPASTYAVGGQSTVSGWDVLSCREGFVEDREPHQDIDGSHKADIVYSRRRTFELELKAMNGTTSATLVAGGTMTYDSILCNIINVQFSKTRGPMVATVSLVQQADTL